MELINQRHRGVIYFSNNEMVLVAQRQYSHDGKNYWEDYFVPHEHTNPMDPRTTIGGHKWMRIRHEGDDFFQPPMRIVADQPEFKVDLNADKEYSLYYKLLEEADWKELFNLKLIEGKDGEPGRPGQPGQGLHIDLYGYYNERPSCPTSCAKSSCSSCSSGGCSSCATPCSATTGALFMSLGDGSMPITSSELGKYRSDDGKLWVQIYINDVGRSTRFIADGPLGENYLDYRQTNYLNTRGLIYVCADGTWSPTTLSASSYLVKESFPSSKIGFLSDYVHYYPTTGILPGTITMQDGFLEVNIDSLNYTHLKLDTFNKHFIHDQANPVALALDVVAGDGLYAYDSSTEAVPVLGVNPEDFINDGLAVFYGPALNPDGSLDKDIIVNVNDLIDPFSGLEVVEGTDEFDNLKVKAGQAIAVNNLGVNVLYDDVAITVDSNQLTIKDYGVKIEHLNPNVVAVNGGLRRTDAGLIVIPDTARGIGVTAAGVGILNLGVSGSLLNPNVANELAGIQLRNQKLEVKLDGDYLEFDNTGNITITDDFFANLPNDAVTAIQVDAINKDGVVALNSTSSNPIITSDWVWSGQVAELKLGINEVALDAYLDDWLTGQSDAVTDAEVFGALKNILKNTYPVTLAFDDINKTATIGSLAVTYETPIGNMVISKDRGIYIRSGNTYYKLSADSNRNLYLDSSDSWIA